jgi:hypothetical protein
MTAPLVAFQELNWLRHLREIQSNGLYVSVVKASSRGMLLFLVGDDKTGSSEWLDDALRGGWVMLGRAESQMTPSTRRKLES